MTKRLSDDELVLRGRQAQSVLSTPVLREAIDGMRERAIERWREHGSAADREEEWRFVRTIDAFETYLTVAMRQGTAVAKRREDAAARSRRLRRTIGLA